MPKSILRAKLQASVLCVHNVCHVKSIPESTAQLTELQFIFPLAENIWKKRAAMDCYCVGEHNCYNWVATGFYVIDKPLSISSTCELRSSICHHQIAFFVLDGNDVHFCVAHYIHSVAHRPALRMTYCAAVSLPRSRAFCFPQLQANNGECVKRYRPCGQSRLFISDIQCLHSSASAKYTPVVNGFNITVRGLGSFSLSHAR